MEKYRDLFDHTMVPEGSVIKNKKYNWIPADKFLTSERIDLIPKLIYIDSIVNNKGKEYAEYLYKEHLACFSHGKFYEPGNNEKNSFEMFKRSFKATYLSLSNNGYNPDKTLIPVSSGDFILIDGAHRVSSAIYLNIDIPVVEVGLKKKCFDIKYFSREGMKESDLDFICHKYISINKNKTFNAICLWPKSSEYHTKIEQEIKSKFKILVKKKLKLNENGAHNFLSQIYSHDNWVGDYKNDFQGVSTKRSSCFSNDEMVSIYFVESEYDLNTITEFKNGLRKEFGFGKHLLHITDTKDECIQICELILNNSSIHHLNLGYPTISKNFQKQFNDFLKEVERLSIPLGGICVVGGAVLSVFGIRDTSDIDYISLSPNADMSDKYDLKNYEFEKIDINTDDVILNPDFHFYYMGVRFCSLSILSKLKSVRGEPKDIDDVKAIEIFLSSDKTLFSTVKMKFFLIKRYIRRTIISVRVLIGDLLRKLGLLSTVKKILRV